MEGCEPREREVDLCNSGMMAVRSADLWPLLDKVGNDNCGAGILPSRHRHDRRG
jgi:bifunctional N-acetylglucosamine-1-phosphate-uridyltransferase/glucosamine-1-phosphate-acetyltransferase GlmU-like protein